MYCPGCNSEELYLIGATIGGQVGVIYEGSITLELLGAIKPVVNHGFLICRACKRQWTTNEVNEFNGAVKSNILWEVNHEGIKIPIVCPLCKNTRSFIRTIKIEYTVDQEVEITEGEIVSVIPENPMYDWELTSDSQKITVLTYDCAVDSCTGYISLRPRE